MVKTRVAAAEVGFGLCFFPCQVQAEGGLQISVGLRVWGKEFWNSHKDSEVEPRRLLVTFNKNSPASKFC